MKLFLSLILIALLSSCDNKEKTIKITGTVRFATEGYIVFSKLNPNKIIPIDTIKLINNKYFNYKYKLDTPDYYTIDFFGKQRVHLILNNDDIELEVDGNNSLGFGQINGSVEHFILNEFRSQIDSLEATDEIVKLKSNRREAYIQRDNLRIDSLNTAIKLWTLHRNRILIDFLKKYDLSLAHLQASTFFNDSLGRNYKKEIAPKLLNLYPTSKNVLYLNQMMIDSSYN